MYFFFSSVLHLSSNTVSYSDLSWYQIKVFFSPSSQRNFITFLSNLGPCFLHFSPSPCSLFQGASSLLDMILYYESTTHLDVSDNSSMGTSAWRALAHLIKQVGRGGGAVIFSCTVGFLAGITLILESEFGARYVGRRRRAKQTG